MISSFLIRWGAALGVWFLLLSGSVLADTVFRVSTLAGNGSPGLIDSLGTNAAFSHPTGVAVDGSGNVYVADMMNHLVRKILTNGVVVTLAGSSQSGFVNGSGTNASFYYPSSVAVDQTGNIYVADSYNNAIRKIATNGIVSTVAGYDSYGFLDGVSTNALFNNPVGIAIDRFGNIVVADSDNCSIRKISTSGTVSTLAGNGHSGFANGTGTNATFSFPQGVTVDSLGNVFVADAGNNAIRKISPTGIVTTVAGNGSYGFKGGFGTNASFREPNNVAVDGTGNIFVSDDNNSIRLITPDGMVTTIVGGAWGKNDGDGLSATFRHPSGLAINAEGVYVADIDNNCIRKLLPVFVKTPQAISFGLNRSMIFKSNLSIPLNATASSGLPVSFTSDSSIITIKDSVAYITGTGTAVIVAKQEGNGSYAAAPPVTNTIIVYKASNSINFLQPPATTFSNGKTVYLAATSPGGPVTFSTDIHSQISIENSMATIHGAGTFMIKASQKGSTNYVSANSVIRNLVVNKAPQVISFNPSNNYLFNSRESISLSGSSSSGLPVLFKCDDVSTLFINGTNGLMKKRGTVRVTAYQTGNENYLPVTNEPVSITLQ